GRDPADRLRRAADGEDLHPPAAAGRLPAGAGPGRRRHQVDQGQPDPLIGRKGTAMSEPQWRVVVGCDDAGLQYKEILKADLDADDRVGELIDVGVTAEEDTTYPHVAVAAAKLIAEGKADRALLVCGTGL